MQNGSLHVSKGYKNNLWILRHPKNYLNFEEKTRVLGSKASKNSFSISIRNFSFFPVLSKKRFE